MRTSGLLHGQPASTRYGIKWLKMSDFHFASIGCATQHLKSVVLALGGSRRLHFLYLHQLLMLPPDALPSFSKRNPLPCVIGLKTPAYWWKDKVHLSLSLLFILLIWDDNDKGFNQAIIYFRDDDDDTTSELLHGRPTSTS